MPRMSLPELRTPTSKSRSIAGAGYVSRVKGGTGMRGLSTSASSGDVGVVLGHHARDGMHVPSAAGLGGKPSRAAPRLNGNALQIAHTELVFLTQRVATLKEQNRVLHETLQTLRDGGAVAELPSIPTPKPTPAPAPAPEPAVIESRAPPEPERADASTQCASAPTCVHAGTMTETTEHDKAAADKEAKAERQRRHQAAASQAELEALRLELAACQAATEQAVAAARAEVEADLQSQMEIREMVAREEVAACRADCERKLSELQAQCVKKITVATKINLGVIAPNVTIKLSKHDSKSFKAAGASSEQRLRDVLEGQVLPKFVRIYSDADRDMPLTLIGAPSADPLKPSADQAWLQQHMAKMRSKIEAQVETVFRR